MKIRLIASLAIAVVAVAAMALPAAAVADNSDVGAFTGVANVTPLGLPGTSPVTGSWSLVTTLTSAVAGAGTLNASGGLSPVANIGAACGMSHGHSGSGTAGAYNLSNLGWVATAGGTLPVTGHYTVAGGSGPVVAIVQAQGGANCASNSANSFQVAGVFAAL
jgi:hypothetical protein